MFDDLHDPAPPAVGLDTLARVSARAKAIRRRRLAMSGAGMTAVAALVIGTVVVAGRSEPSIVPASSTGKLFADPERMFLDLAASADLPRCAGAPVPPPWLEDGALPGVGVDDRVTVVGETYRTVRWGTGDVAVHQFEDSDVALWPERATPASFATSVGPIPFVEVPGGGIPGSRHVRIVDEPGGCRRDYLVGEMRLGVGLNVATWTLQDALATEGLDAVDRAEWGICATIADEDAVCLPDQTVDRQLVTGVAGASYEVLTNTSFGAVTIAEFDAVGVFHVLVGADDVVAPLSRHAIEVPIAGTGLKSVVDLTLPAPAHCVVVTSPSGDRSTVGARAPIVSDDIVESPEIDCQTLGDAVVPAAPASTDTPTSLAGTSTAGGRVDVDPECLASLAPVWLQDGSAADAPVGDADVTLPDGTEVEALSWGSRRTGTSLLQLTTVDGAHPFATGAGSAYRTDAEAMSPERTVLTIGRRADGCAAQFLVDGSVEQALMLASAWVDQLTVADMGIGVTVEPDGLICPAVGGVAREDACVGVDPVGEPVGAVSQGFVVTADGDGDPLSAPVGVVFVLMPADADVAPRSRLAQEEIVDDGRWKAFVDIVPDDESWCVEITDGADVFPLGTRLSGERSNCPIGT